MNALQEIRGKVVLADDEESARIGLGRILQEDGYRVSLAASGEEALELVASEHPEVLLTDLKMAGMDGSELLSRVRRGYPGVAVVIMTAHGNIRSAVDALRDGAEDYLTKPLNVEEVEQRLDQILKRRTILSETGRLNERPEGGSFDSIVGRSPEMAEVMRLVEQVAAAHASVLITGESGTGKDLIAQAIHKRSARRAADFVKVSCAALPETLLEAELFGHERGAFTGALARRSGRFEVAAGGTVFLDEVGDIPPAMQVKLLRFLQEHQFERVGGNQTLTVDVRVIAATHRNLPSLIREGRFREDLFYRLNVIEIHLPPLRSRIQDIPLLADFFLKKYAAANGKRIACFTSEALAALMAYPWPGNVRELEHCIERAVVLTRSEALNVSLFPGLSSDRPPLPFGGRSAGSGASMAEIEREAILRTLESVGGSKSRAAAILKISPRTIQYKVKQYRAERLPAAPRAPEKTT